MHRTALIVAVGAAALVGAGATAVASAGSATSGRPVVRTALAAAGSASGGHRPGPAFGQRHWRRPFRRVEHAQVVTSGPRGTVVHDAIRGVVSTMSPSSLTVRAADGFSETFLLSSVTRVRVRPGGAAPGRGRHASLSRISRGDQVFAIGKAVDRTGSVPTARLVIVGVKR